MRKRMFSSPFISEGRIGRIEYILTIVLWLLWDVALTLIFGNVGVGVLIHSVVNIFLIVMVLNQGAKRCHDLNKSGVWQLIPLFFIYMMVAPAVDEDNEYE